MLNAKISWQQLLIVIFGGLALRFFFSVAKFQNEFQKIPVYGLHEWFFFINGADNYNIKYSHIDRAAWNSF